MKKNSVICLLVLGAILFSCKKDDNYQPKLIAMYSVIVTGPKIDFTNMSGYFDAYHWNFGDGDTSNAISPTHIYPSKGKYIVTLKGIGKNGYTDTFTDTVWAQNPTIAIDGDFSDWEYVPYAYQNKSGTGENLIALKTFYSATKLFFLVEGSVDMKLNPFHIYFDTDGNPETGYNPPWFPYTAGIERMYEGGYNGWQTLMKYTGTRQDWSWELPAISKDFFNNKGGIINVNGVYKIEFSAKKSDFASLPKIINVGVEDMPNWSPGGLVPSAGGLVPMQTRD